MVFKLLRDNEPNGEGMTLPVKLQGGVDAIQGSGAFQRFKGMIRRRELERAWRSYRDAAIEKIAISFLEMEDIPFQPA